MAFETHEPSIRNVNFVVERTVDVPETLIAVTKRAASLIWQRNVHEPTTMRLGFYDSLAELGSSFVLARGVYLPSEDLLATSVSRIREDFEHLPNGVESGHALVGGHEAAHRWQLHRGVVLKSNGEFDSIDEYANDPNEAQAWYEGLHALAYLYPRESISFQVGRRTFDSPLVSKYATRGPVYKAERETSRLRTNNVSTDKSYSRRSTISPSSQLPGQPTERNSKTVHRSLANPSPIRPSGISNNSLMTPKIEPVSYKMPGTILKG